MEPHGDAEDGGGQRGGGVFGDVDECVAHAPAAADSDGDAVTREGELGGGGALVGLIVGRGRGEGVGGVADLGARSIDCKGLRRRLAGLRQLRRGCPPPSLA